MFFWFFLTSQGHRCGVFISCNHCVTLNCSLRSNNINFFGPLCWGKYPLSLPTQPEPSNLRPPPLHTPMEIKGGVGDSWPCFVPTVAPGFSWRENVFVPFRAASLGQTGLKHSRIKKGLKQSLRAELITSMNLWGDQSSSCLYLICPFSLCLHWSQSAF